MHNLRFAARLDNVSLPVTVCGTSPSGVQTLLEGLVTFTSPILVCTRSTVWRSISDVCGWVVNSLVALEGLILTQTQPSLLFL